MRSFTENPEVRKHYDVFGLDYDSSRQLVRRAYVEYVKTHHPNSSEATGQYDSDEFEQKKNAYIALMEIAPDNVEVQPLSPVEEEILKTWGAYDAEANTTIQGDRESERGRLNDIKV